MKIFLSSVEEGSFTKASAKQNISQPAATIAINQIEETIGEMLFQRNGSSRKAMVTPAGQKVAETFSRIVAGYETELASISRALGVERGKRHILIQAGLDYCLDVTSLETLAGLYPDDELQFGVSTRQAIFDSMRDRKADLALIDGRMKDERFDYLQLGRYNLVCVHPASATAPLTRWEDIDGRCYILGTIDPAARRQIVEQLRRASGAPDCLVDVGSLPLLRQLLHAAPAPAILPNILVNHLDLPTDVTQTDLFGHQVDAPIGILTQWGHLARLETSKLRRRPFFE